MRSDNFDANIGDRLRKIREASGKSQAQIARKANCSVNTIGNYENNVSDPSFWALRAYHKLTGASYDYLLDGKIAPEHDDSADEKSFFIRFCALPTEIKQLVINLVNYLS